MNKHTVYLCGPITGLTQERATAWRAQAKEFLSENGYAVIDPMQGKNVKNNYCPDAIVETDVQSVHKSDILLVDMVGTISCWDKILQFVTFGKYKPRVRTQACIGTSMEIRIAWEAGKVILVFGRANRKSYWLQYHTTLFFDDLAEVLNFLTAF